jgi:cysteine-S-conjugate beta-lyase
MNRYSFNAVIERRGTDSVKWDPSVIKALGAAPDALPFWVADMDFAAPPEVVEALSMRCSHPIFGYPSRSPDLTDLLVQWLEKRHNWAISPRTVIPVPGLMTGIAAAVRLLTRPGEGVVLHTPAYKPFFSTIEQNGRTVVRSPLRRSGGTFLIDFSDLELHLSQSENTLLLLCSPHNPAGRVWSQEEIQRILSLCSRYGTAVVSDEIHADLSYPGHVHTPCGRQAGNIPSITLTAPSKTFNIAGEKCAFAVIPDEQLNAKYRTFLERLSLSELSIFALTAAAAAYRSGGQWLDELIVYLRENLAFMKDYLARFIPELELIEPEASFIAFIDCRNLAPLLKPGVSPAAFFAREAGILLHDGAWFGPEGAGYARINFGTPRSLLETAMDRMRSAVERMRT